MNQSNALLLNKVLMDGIQEILLVIRVDEDHGLYYDYINKMAVKRTSLTMESTGKALREVHTDEDYHFFRTNHLQVIHSKQELLYEDTFQSPEGDHFFSETRLTPLLDEYGQVTHIVVLVHDITSKKLAEMELENSKEKLVESRDQFRIIAENSHDLISLISDDGHLNYVSPSSRTLLGIGSEEFIGKHFSVFVHPQEQELLQRAFDDSVAFKKPLREKYRMQNNEGDWLWFELHGSSVYNEQGVYSHFVAVSRDITSSREYEKRLKYFAYHDVLTDLPNRRLFYNNLTEALMQKTTVTERAALVLIDIDNFKNINDGNGHDIGDLVIVEFANRLRRIVQSDGCSFARLGGDEFAVILPAVSGVDEALSEAEKVLHAVQVPWEFADRTLNVTVSIGVAMAPEKEFITSVSMLKKADLALYEAKEAGRNCIRINE